MRTKAKRQLRAEAVEQLPALTETIAYGNGWFPYRDGMPEDWESDE